MADCADGYKLAKASTLALISMLVIIVTVITQGPRIPADMRGPIKGSILINSGVFQAIGVISFGKPHRRFRTYFQHLANETLQHSYAVGLSPG